MIYDILMLYLLGIIVYTLFVLYMFGGNYRYVWDQYIHIFGRKNMIIGFSITILLWPVKVMEILIKNTRKRK